MKSKLSVQKKGRVAKLCKENPYYAMDLAECIFNFLQMKTIKEFADISVVSERTLYSHVNDIENTLRNMRVLQ